MKLQSLVLVLTIGLLLAADTAAKKDLEQLQGIWQVTALEVDGNQAPDEALKEFKITVKGDRMSHKTGETTEESSFKLDPSKKPKQIDFTVVAGTDKGKNMKAIYELDGDSLKLCVGSPGAERPTEFASKAGTKIGLIVLKRTKP